MSTITSKRHKTFSTFFSPSKRLSLTYIVLFVWIALAIFAIIMKADLYALAVYFTSGLPIIIGYLWAQTSRPSLSEASEILKNINPKGQPTNYPIMDQYQTYGQPYNQFTNQVQTNNQSEINIISIYADDASAELKITQEQLSTLMNIGYIDNIANKYTFKKSNIEQIKSLLDSSTQDPII